MKKYILGVLAVTLLFFGGMSVFAQSTSSTITKHVYKGWNLLGNGEDFPRPLMEKAQYIFSYVPILNKYYRIKPELTKEEKEKITSELKQALSGSGIDFNYFDRYVRGSYWFYYPEEGDVIYTVPKMQKELFAMLTGWNFKFITSDMIGQNFNDITGNCNVKKAYAYDALKATEGQNPWQNLIGFYFDKEKGSNVMGHGMIVNVEKNCQFSLKDQVPALPQLPN
ncbi:MAG: hypothetical protein AAB432_02440 [Patescibacteria group bacterium]